MRIGEPLAAQYIQNPVIPRFSPEAAQQPQNQAPPGVVLDISPEAWAAYRQGGAPAGGAADPLNNNLECRTCESRTYQDVSDDSSVSFQSPTRISPGQAASMVAAHEGEHVANEQARADREGREIISQTVTLRTSICPECKIVYVSGGETRTLSAAAKPSAAEQAVEQAAKQD